MKSQSVMGEGGCSPGLLFPSHLKPVFAEKYTHTLKPLMYRPTINLLSSHDSRERSWEMIDGLHLRERGLAERPSAFLSVTLQETDLLQSPHKSEANL